MSGACGTCGRRGEVHTWFQCGNLKERGPLGDTGIVVGSCACSNDLLGSIKCGEVTVWLNSDLSDCFMELIGWLVCS